MSWLSITGNDAVMDEAKVGTVWADVDVTGDGNVDASMQCMDQLNAMRGTLFKAGQTGGSTDPGPDTKIKVPLYEKINTIPGQLEIDANTTDVNNISGKQLLVYVTVTMRVTTVDSPASYLALNIYHDNTNRVTQYARQESVTGYYFSVSVMILLEPGENFNVRFEYSSGVNRLAATQVEAYVLRIS